ncbi:hypothetical protein PS15p_211175 [Mucor circinelloides]
MTRSLTQSALPQQPYNQEDLANEWEEAYHNKSNSLLKRSTVKSNTTSNTFNHYNAIFSDDDEDDLPPQQHGLTSRWFHTQQQNHSSASTIPSSNATMSAGYIDPVLSSSTYHIHQADNALLTLKHVILEDGWKKALKHKSGVMVHMKNGIHKGDRTPIFKGEAVIQGFSPQAIFYVIGMRKLWDEQYEDGNLVENLNDTTSLTYEVMKPTATSKSRDLALVEKIECTQNGAIVFACTSVETPRIPKINGRTRVNTKLQGWVLEPLHGGPHPATKVIFVVQENMKGWVPGFAKKTLARRPLVIAKVAEYLERKTERMRSQQTNKSGLLQSINSGHSRRPSVMSSHLPQQTQQLRHFNSTNKLRQQQQQAAAAPEHLHHSTILVAPTQQQQQQQPTPIIVPAPQPSSIGSNNKKHISFAEHDITYTANQPPQNTASIENSPTTTNPYKNVLPVPAKNNATGRHLYPSHRHPIQKVESIQLLKKLTFSLDNWNLTKELDDGSKHYMLNARLLSDDDEEENMLQMKKSSKSNARKVPFIRADGIIQGGWTAEQLCSVIHCFGARKIWDPSFEGGQSIERFSQKEYLVQWYLGSMLPIASVDLSAITSIETDPITGTVYTATTSVTDKQVPPDEVGHRIRAYTDLYGWVFRPKFDKHGRTVQVAVSFVCNMDFKYALPQHVLQTWMDTSLQSITHMHHYLTQYGCPPYIRRVAGKVVQEGFDALTNNYQIIFIAKHQPSNSYRARKQNQNSSLWCTDIRFHRTMFPHGLDIKIMPENIARVQISPKEQKSIKVFTTDESIDGKQVTFTLTPLYHSEAAHYTTYKYNGELFTQQQPQAILDSSSKSDGDTTASSEPNTPSPATTKFVNSKQIIVDGESSLSSTSTAGASGSTPAAGASMTDTASVVAEAVVKVVEKEIVKKHDASTTSPAITVTKVEIEKILKKEDMETKTEEEEKQEDALPIPLKVPKGYLLVPEHQNNNIIIITDELSFNGQQISVIFLAMVICYYMGKFTSCSSC